MVSIPVCYAAVTFRDRGIHVIGHVRPAKIVLKRLFHTKLFWILSNWEMVSLVLEMHV